MGKIVATTVASMLFSGVADASLIGTELRIGAINQVSATSELFLIDFPASAIVSEDTIEFPSADSLFSGFDRPPGSYIVDTSINAGGNYIEVDFDNAGNGRFASWYRNAYIFGFTSEALVTITGASVDRSVSNLGVNDSSVYFEGGNLFVDASGLSFNPDTFLRINLEAEIGPDPDPEPPVSPVPLPASLPLMVVVLGALFLKRRGA